MCASSFQLEMISFISCTSSHLPLTGDLNRDRRGYITGWSPVRVVHSLETERRRRLLEVVGRNDHRDHLLKLLGVHMGIFCTNGSITSDGRRWWQENDLARSSMTLEAQLTALLVWRARFFSAILFT